VLTQNLCLLCFKVLWLDNSSFKAKLFQRQIAEMSVSLSAQHKNCITKFYSGLYALEAVSGFLLVPWGLPEDTKGRVWFMSEGARDALEIAIVI